MGKKRTTAKYAVVLKPTGPAQTRKQKQEVAVTPKKHERIYHRDKGLCFWCGKKVILGSSSRKLMATKDHLMPHSKGGGHGMDNLVLSCGPCNSSKSNYLINPVTNQPISPAVLSVFLRA